MTFGELRNIYRKALQTWKKGGLDWPTIARYEVAVRQLSIALKAVDTLSDAIHPKRGEKPEFWTVENLAILAQAHHQDSQDVDAQAGADQAVDYAQVAVLRQQRLATAHRHLGRALANRACDKWCDDDDGYCVTCLWGEAEHQELAAIRAYYEAHK